MKKKMVVMLSLVLCLLLSISFAACKGNNPETPDNPSEPSAPAGQTDPADQHEAKSAWSSDETEHWRDCATAGHTDKLEKAAHTFGEWSEKTPAGYGTDRVVERSCTVCGRQEERTDENSALAPKDNTVKVGKIDFTYNAKSQPIDSLVTAGNQEGMTIQYEGTGEPTYAQSATAPKNAGTYRYTITIPATAEWNAAEFSGEYTIAKYELTEVYGKVHTKEYSGTTGISVTVNPFDGEEVSVTIAMKGAAAGTKEIAKILVVGEKNKNNYTVDQEKVTAEIVPKKLGGFDLKVTATEVPTDATGTKVITFVLSSKVIDGDKGKVAVTVTFNAQDLWGTPSLDLTTGNLEQGKAKIELKTDGDPAYLNYELDIDNLGILSLVR